MMGDYVDDNNNIC